MVAGFGEFDGLENVDIAHTRDEFRRWLKANHDTERECWLKLKRGKPVQGEFAYLDAVEEALCFGWIDGHLKAFEGQGTLQRFSPRAKDSSWSELNKERVRKLERLGLMTDAGRACLPAMGPRSFHIDKDIVRELKEARLWTRFKGFPALYQRVRADNIQRVKSNPEEYRRRLDSLIEHTRKGEHYGEWDDYGRLSAWQER